MKDTAKISKGKPASLGGKTTKMNERKRKKPNMRGKTSEGNIGNPAH